MTVEWKRRAERFPAHAIVDEKPICGRKIHTELYPVALTSLGDPLGRVCEYCCELAKAMRTPTHREERKLLRDPPSTYGKILRKQSTHGMRWFKVAYRLAVSKYPCSVCRFALATHGRFDAAFGIGRPVACRDCAMSEARDDGDWKPVDPKKAYDGTTQTIIEAIGDEWLVPRVP